MPNPLTSVVLSGNTYDEVNAAITQQYRGQGGRFFVQDGNVWVKLQYGVYGTEEWTDETEVPVGAGTIDVGAIGIAFRNDDATVPATVSASIKLPGRPGITLGASGIATPATSSMITGQVAATGAITAGSGFTVAAGGAGVYTVTFNTAFATVPTVLAILGPTAPAASRFMVVTAVTTGQVVFATGPGTNQPFNFVAFTTV
jgi:hypothetical protein